MLQVHKVYKQAVDEGSQPFIIGNFVKVLNSWT